MKLKSLKPVKYDVIDEVWHIIDRRYKQHVRSCIGDNLYNFIPDPRNIITNELLGNEIR